MDSEKLAVILPGIGYHKDKPLLYYASRIAQCCGYTAMYIAYHDMPQKIRGDAEMMQKAALLACRQTAEQMESVHPEKYREVLLIGKSIGTVAAAQYAADNNICAKQIWYTPLMHTFSITPPPAGECIAFLGEDDPWSDVSQLKTAAKQLQMPLYLYPECNHSLECGDIIRNIENLKKIMEITSDFISC